MKPKVLVIVGPTASGKSDLAVRLAKRFNGEVISADSRQVYRGLNIGTGKITKKEMRGVKHHLLDIADPKRQFTVQDYKELAERAIADITSRGKLPIICGGTGFYIDAVVNDAKFPAVKADEKLRAKFSKKPAGRLLAMLKKLDPKRWKTINYNPSEKKNARRIIRAIEVATALKKERMAERALKADIAAVHTASGRPRRARAPLHRPDYKAFFIGIQPLRPESKRGIHVRLLSRLKAGMVAEARHLHAEGLSWKRMEELGLEYRYLSRYLRGFISQKEMAEKLDIEIGRYAKRQMTWWKKNKKIKWFKPRDIGSVKKTVGSFLKD